MLVVVAHFAYHGRGSQSPVEKATTKNRIKWSATRNKISLKKHFTGNAGKGVCLTDFKNMCLIEKMLIFNHYTCPRHAFWDFWTLSRCRSLGTYQTDT